MVREKAHMHKQHRVKRQMGNGENGRKYGTGSRRNRRQIRDGGGDVPGTASKSTPPPGLKVPSPDLKVALAMVLNSKSLTGTGEPSYDFKLL